MPLTLGKYEPVTLLSHTYTVVLSLYILQIITILAFAVVATEGIDTSSVVGTEDLSGSTLVNV